MKTNDEAAAMPTNRISRTTNRDERVGNPIQSALRKARPPRVSPPPTRERGPGSDIPLAGLLDGIKSEKEGMKYIRSPIRRGANGSAIATARPRGGIRHLLRHHRYRLLAVRARPAGSLVSGRHHPMGLHDLHARRGDLPRRTRGAGPQHPRLILAAAPRGRCATWLGRATVLAGGLAGDPPSAVGGDPAEHARHRGPRHRRAPRKPE